MAYKPDESAMVLKRTGSVSLRTFLRLLWGCCSSISGAFKSAEAPLDCVRITQTFNGKQFFPKSSKYRISANTFCEQLFFIEFGNYRKSK